MTTKITDLATEQLQLLVDHRDLFGVWGQRVLDLEVERRRVLRAELGVSVTLLLDTAGAEYLLERLGGPAHLDSCSSERERADAVSYDCIVGQLERGLEAARRAR
jgi:hypothetical protein